MNLPNVIVVMSKCSRRSGTLFGIRLAETSARTWEATWAFPLPEEAVSREHYDRQRAEGVITLGPEYPGCPGCGGASVVLCSSCSRLGCWDQETKIFRCPWCGVSGQIRGTITKLSGGADG